MNLCVHLYLYTYVTIYKYIFCTYLYITYMYIYVYIYILIGNGYFCEKCFNHTHPWHRSIHIFIKLASDEGLDYRLNIVNNNIKKERIKDFENSTLNIIHMNRKQLDNLNNNDAKIDRNMSIYGGRIMEVHTCIYHSYYTLITPLVHSYYTLIALLLHSYCTLITLLLHPYYTLITPLLHPYYTLIAPLLHSYYTLVPLLCMGAG
jgi:hypothetical protein